MIQIHGKKKKKRLKYSKRTKDYNYNLHWKYFNSFNFFNLVQCIVICRYTGVVNLVESNHNWVSGLWILFSQHYKNQNFRQQQPFFFPVKGRRKRSNLVNSYNRPNVLVPVGLPSKNPNLYRTKALN